LGLPGSFDLEFFDIFSYLFDRFILPNPIPPFVLGYQRLNDLSGWNVNSQRGFLCQHVIPPSYDMTGEIFGFREA